MDSMTAAQLYDPPMWHIPDDLHVLSGAAILEDAWHLPPVIWDPIRKIVTGKKVRAAVCDTGYTKHEALPVPITTRSYIRGESIDDENSHGVHCAGILLGRNRKIGVAPDAEYLAYKVLSNRGSGGSDGIAASIRQALEDGADVVSLSLGGGSAYGPTNAAIRECINAGVWVCIAAGNSGFNGRTNTIGEPARSGEGIVVGATREDGGISGFSSGGPQLTVACPGERILSCTPDGRYGYKSGTSMATPFMAGLACLIIELMRREGGARMTGIQAMTMFLKSIAEDRGAPGHDPSYGHGVPTAADIIRVLANGDLKWI